MKPTIIPALAAALLAIACHPHDGPSLAAPSADRHPVVLDGVALSSVAAANRGQPGDTLTGAAAGTLLAAVLDPGLYPPGDRAEAERALVRAYSAPIGYAVAWEGRTGRGTITPVRTPRHAGPQCREFRQVVRVGEQDREGYGQACRQPDGTWARA